MRSACGVLLLGVLLVAGVFAMAHADTPGLAQWLPDESYAGGKQADPRLDKPVQFWRAGVTLADAFTDLTQQTDVKLAFFSENDENRRVRVNLFLNKEQPPTLRGLMVQLAWAVDCPFSLSEEGGQKIYLLMSTSVGQNAEQALRTRRNRGQTEADQFENAAALKADELQRALALSREDVISRYQGKDDFILLTLLEPRRRAATEFVCRHALVPAGHYIGIGDRGPALNSPIGVLLQALDAEGRAALQTAFGISDEAFRDPQASCWMTQSDGRVILSLSETIQPATGFPAEYVVVDVSGGSTMQPEDEVALRRLLGEQVTAGEEATYVSQRHPPLGTVQAPAAPKGPALSRPTQERLSALTLPLAQGRVHPMWEVQEAVAKALRMHVVSDAFVWWESSLPAAGKAATPVGALAALGNACRAQGSDDRTGFRKPEWEWGDAGSFLRFRSANRDAWRAAMLPEQFLEWIDESIGPSLPNDGAMPRGGFDVTFVVDAEEWVRRMNGLDDMQLRYGYLECYSDPNGSLTLARRAVLDEVLLPISRYPHLTHFLGSLTHAQWERLCSGGLRSPADLSPDLHRLLLAGFFGDLGGGDPAEYGTSGWTASVQLQASSESGGSSASNGVASRYRLKMDLRKGTETMGAAPPYLPARVAVHVRAPEPGTDPGEADPSLSGTAACVK